jgi:hypothetical protein
LPALRNSGTVPKPTFSVVWRLLTGTHGLCSESIGMSSGVFAERRGRFPHDRIRKPGKERKNTFTKFLWEFVSHIGRNGNIQFLDNRSAVRLRENSQTQEQALFDYFVALEGYLLFHCRLPNH